MLTASELDGTKFSFMITPQKDFNHFKALQKSVLQETVPIERKEANMFLTICERLDFESDYERQMKQKKAIELDKELSRYERYSMVLDIVMNLTGLSAKQIKSAGRQHKIILARSITIFCMRWSAGYSLNEIGKIVSDKEKFDHSTVISNCKRVCTAIQIRQKDMYTLLCKTVLKLRDKGIDINLEKEQPNWYLDMMEKLNN